MNLNKNNKLTSKNYWESYYENNNTGAKEIIDICSYYDKYWDILFADKNKDASLIEIGGYPGRYLAYLANKYDVLPTCLDYNKDLDKIKATFKSMGVVDYDIQVKDFLNYEPLNQYDYVISNGFIEHFIDYDTVLDLHIKYLKPNGKLLVMIPNMRGYINLYKKVVDKNNLQIHNQKVMSKRVFENFANRNNLNTVMINYFGEFPHTVHQDLNKFQRIIFKAHRILFKKFFNKYVLKYPNKYFSSGIIAIYQKQ